MLVPNHIFGIGEGATENAEWKTRERQKWRGWKTREWKSRHHNAEVENAREASMESDTFVCGL